MDETTGRLWSRGIRWLLRQSASTARLPEGFPLNPQLQNAETTGSIAIQSELLEGDATKTNASPVIHRPVPARLGRRVEAASPPAAKGNGRPKVDGKFLCVEGKRFWVKGVTYGTFALNDEGEPYPPLPQVRDDFARMREAGINTVRLYTPPSDRMADAAAEAGLYLIPDFCWELRRSDWNEPDRMRHLLNRTRQHINRLAAHPAILMYSIANEVPPLVVRWLGREQVEAFLRTLYEMVKEHEPDSIVTYVNHPPTEYLNLPFLDVMSYNIYLEREPEFRAYLARLQILAGEKPLLLAEMGLDARRNGEVAQAQFLDWQLRATFEKGLCGTIVYGWTDEWAIYGTEIEGWEFGLTKADRTPKMALAAVSQVYNSGLYRLRKEPWPLVSVVVCCYNAASTIKECLQSLANLNYPRYEVIVIDDGSTDATHEFAEAHGMQCIRVSNGGLSKARNIGVDASRGDYVAFIDADAYADANWLYYIVTALEEHHAAGVGGPNLSPPTDNFTAQCVDQAPGNPTCVLVDNEHAEHVPGCNMAFRKEIFNKVATFDPAHRCAGDDVDLCWKLLVSNKKIVYSPSAVVWHHRRNTIRGYLRQQRGYGFAEAHLRRRYPGRYNLFGHVVWQGGIYDAVHTGLRRHGLPALFRSQIYRGCFGSAQFQSIYQPFLTWWFQIFTAVEWQGTSACLLAAGLLGLLFSPATSVGLLIVAGAMIVSTLAAAALAGRRAVHAKGWRGIQRWRGFLTVAWLHILQPVARAVGRLHGGWHLRNNPLEFPASQRLTGDMVKREKWLRRLLRYINECGWVCRPSGDWDEADLDILGPGPYRLQLCSVCEDHLPLGREFVRYRVAARIKPGTPFLAAALVMCLIGLLFAPHLLPLAFPVGVLLYRVLRAKRSMVQAVSQMAAECAWPLEMKEVKEKI